MESIKINTKNYKKYNGIISCAMIYNEKDIFSIIYVKKERHVKNISSLPYLVTNFIDTISSSKECKIFYNNELNVETFLTSYIIYLFYTKHNIYLINDNFLNNIEYILKDKNLQNNIQCILSKYDIENIEDFDFKNVEEEIFNLISSLLSLQKN